MEVRKVGTYIIFVILLLYVSISAIYQVSPTTNSSISTNKDVLTVGFDPKSCLPNDSSFLNPSVILIPLNSQSHACAVTTSDEELIKRCQEALLHPVILKWPKLPKPPPLPEGSQNQTLQLKYQKRITEDHACLKPKGMWGNPFNSRCTYVTMAQMGNYKPNDLILDWGTGCGHQATWMTR